MAVFKIEVVTGVAALYPDGMEGTPHVMHHGQGLDFGGHRAAGLIADDLEAPAAGVATDEPFGERDGTLRVSVEEGEVNVRVYSGSQFTETVVHAGGNLDAKVIESNRITLAVYELTAKPKGS